jgi:hypothetical protein
MLQGFGTRNWPRSFHEKAFVVKADVAASPLLSLSPIDSADPPLS